MVFFEPFVQALFRFEDPPLPAPRIYEALDALVTRIEAAVEAREQAARDARAGKSEARRTACRTTSADPRDRLRLGRRRRRSPRARPPDGYRAVRSAARPTTVEGAVRGRRAAC